MFLEPTSSTEVHNIINELKNKTTLDTKISGLNIDNHSQNFVTALAMVVNKSFEQGIFSDMLKKTAKVVPIYKEGSKTAVANYRSISLLTSFSKTYEKFMHRRIADFLNANNTLRRPVCMVSVLVVHANILY